MSDEKQPTISVVISTLNRAHCLNATLNSFRWQTYAGKFEIIVVNGPSTDHTEGVLSVWASKIKIGVCPQPNLSASRNIGIRMSSADIIAFIDDDAIPEPEWLDQIARSYRNPEVGAVGGRVFNQTGYQFQYEYCMVDRLGDPITLPRRPMAHRSFPASFTFPHLLGTNSSFRRDILLQIGGFDEAFEYYLDESDVCVRVVDAGYLIKQLDCAYVHHKLAPSSVRDEGRIIRNYYSVIKSRILFSYKHASDYLPISSIIDNQNNFIDQKRREVRSCVDAGLLSEDDADAFEAAAMSATDFGRSTQQEHDRDRKWMPSAATVESAPFICYPRPQAGHTSLTVVLISRDYPPERDGGIATFNRDLAEALAEKGQIVHVICLSSDQNHVNFEDGVWVHRITQEAVKKTSVAQRRGIPQHIWDWSASALAETRRISTHRRIDVVEAPLWDCQGISFLLDGQWPLVTSLQTSLRFWLQSKPEVLRDSEWMKTFGDPMINTERELMRGANAVRAISRAIKSDVQTTYDFQFSDGQVLTAPLGLRDVRHTEVPVVVGDRPITVLFVGRLEHRKGIDILLKAIPLVLATYPQVRFRIIGDDSLPASSGSTYRQQFEASRVGQDSAAQVRFDGRLEEAMLHEAYASCDIFVAPSRYESFGLVFLEAMREGKPVIGCQIGGMPEIIDNEVSGLLVPPGDEALLAQAIIRLVNSADLRRSYGEAGRRSFYNRFTANVMADQSMELYHIATHRPPRRRRLRICYVNGVCAKHDGISNAIVGEIAALKARGYSDVRLYSFACDYAHLPVTIVESANAITSDEYFKTADLVIFHFGIFSPLFEAIAEVSPRSKILVTFQNITPKELVGENDRWIIDKSYEQMKLIRFADCVVCPSEVNRQALRNIGIDVPSKLLPLAVRLETPSPEQKPSFTDKVVRIAFVGRLVRAKGPQDLIAALAMVLGEQLDITVQLTMVGSQRFSDDDFLEILTNSAERLVQDLGDRLTIDFRLDVEDSVKHEILREADLFILPTYHEGFCIPIGEALGAGCRVITYDNSNAGVLGKGLTRIVPTGKVAELAKAISIELKAVRSPAWRGGDYSSYRALADAYVAKLDGASVDKSFIDLIEAFVLPVSAEENAATSAP